MKTITFRDLVPRLVEAVPEFQADSDDIREKLTYPVFNNLMRFVKSLLESKGNDYLTRKIFDFIEQAAKTGDKEIEEVLKDSFHEIAIPEPDKAKPYMGRATLRLFQQVEDEIYGRRSAVQSMIRFIKRL